MSFEEMLRDQLQRDAGAVPLPRRDPDDAADRARRRRRRRRAGRAAAAGVAAAVAAAAAVPPMLPDSPDSLSMAGPGSSGLVPTGPLELDWRSGTGGLSNVRTAFQDDAGVVYALSTGPGAREADHPEGGLPRALYRLTDEGTWEPLVLDGERPRAVDVASGGGLLHAVSTGPASGGEGTSPRLSTSADGGATWSSQEVAPVPPPSTVVPWHRISTMSVESDGATTLALVTTSFFPDVETVFPELADADADHGPGPGEGEGGGDSTFVTRSVEAREEGLALVEREGSGTVVRREGAQAAGDPGRLPTEPPQAAAAREAEVEGEAEGEVVRVVPWADLGVDGPEALGGRAQLFRQAGDRWEPAEIAGGAFGSLTGAELVVAGDRFVATGWSRVEGRTVVLASTDGTSWSPLPLPGEGPVVSVGPVLVQHEGTVLQVSADGGATWRPVDLAGAGLPPDSVVLEIDGGPLGLAMVVARDDRLDLVASGDLIDWTVTPLAEVVGTDEVGEATVVVGEDRIVVTAAPPGDAAEGDSVTAVGTPRRD
jgi:hypothetical protein